jgi:hypothetical protein
MHFPSCVLLGDRRIGVGKAKARYDLCFARFHRFGVALVLVVETEKMQDAVHDEMRQMRVRPLALVRGFAIERLAGERNVAVKARAVLGFIVRRKGEHVGRIVLASISAVQLVNSGIVCKENADFALADFGIAKGRLRGAMSDQFGT